VVLTFLGLNINNADALGWRSDAPDGLPWQLVALTTLAVAGMVAVVTALITRRARRSDVKDAEPKSPMGPSASPSTGSSE
jgi:hypothetical protein